jgi:aminoglycoside phosphotransferase (APT) family kinase protein
MAIPTQRDLVASRDVLRKWLTSRVDIAGDAVSEVEVGEISKPAGAGFTNESLFFDATWRSGGVTEHRELALRVKTTEFNLLYRATEFFEPQYRLMKALAEHTDVPVPAIHWYEEDDSYLGAAFFVMDRVAGQVQPDVPPYWQQGWLHDAAREQQAGVWESAVETVAGINTLDWRAAGLDDVFTLYPPGFDGRLAYYDAALAWAGQDEPNPIAEAGREWLMAHRPATGAGEPLALSWGDARLGNLIFRDFRVHTVLDWEMASIGHPLQDLGWWFLCERALLGDAHTGDDSDPHSLPGFPAKEATIARWGELTGLPTADYEFYEVFAGFRFAVHLQRLGALFKSFGVIAPDSPWSVNNIATQALAPLIGADHPPPEPMPTLPT